jgi:truncated hemoglobin YjbI
LDNLLPSAIIPRIGGSPRELGNTEASHTYRPSISLDAIDNPITKRKLSDKFYKEVKNEPFKEALFKTNNIKEVYKHIFDIIDTTPSILTYSNE